MPGYASSMVRPPILAAFVSASCEAKPGSPERSIKVESRPNSPTTAMSFPGKVRW